MKKILFLVFLLPIMSFAQKITEDKTDEFTKMHVTRTDWETLYQKFSGVIIHVRVSKIDTLVYLDLKLMGAGVISMPGSNNLMLKLSNDSIVTVKNLKATMCCPGCGAVGLSGSKMQGLELSFPLRYLERKLLSENEITKIRIYLTDGFIEEDIKSDNADTFADMVKLIL